MKLGLKYVLLASSMLALVGCTKAKKKAVAAVDKVHEWAHEFEHKVPNKVYFAYDSSTLSPSEKAVLDKQIGWILDHKGGKYTVEGHADERGTREYNLALGARRANSVKEYLTAKGIDPSTIDTVSFGKEKPAVEGSGEAVWSKNRRAVTTYSK